MNRSTALRLLATAALALTVPLALSGCNAISNLIGGGVQNVVEGAVEGATGGDIDLGGTSVPDDFPSEVPLPSGEVLYGAAIGNDEAKVWSVGIKVDSLDSYDDIKAQLVDAGHEIAFESSSGETAQGAFGKDGLSVLVALADDGENGVVATFTVSRDSSS